MLKRPPTPGGYSSRDLESIGRGLASRDQSVARGGVPKERFREGLTPLPKARGPPQAPGPRSIVFFKTTYCARILIEGARFPPFGFAIAEISSNSNEDVSFCRKDLLWPDSDRGRSVSPLRVRHSGDML